MLPIVAKIGILHSINKQGVSMKPFVIGYVYCDGTTGRTTFTGKNAAEANQKFSKDFGPDYLILYTSEV